MRICGRKCVFVIFMIFVVGPVAFLFYAKAPAYSEQEFSMAKVDHLTGIKFDETKIDNQLKIVTYNIGYASGKKNNRSLLLAKTEVEQNLDNIADSIAQLKPDVLALQEVDFNSKRTYSINQMTYLAQKLKMPYVAYVVTWNKRYVPYPYWPPQFHFGKMLSGQAVLSRHPIVAQQIYALEKPKENSFWYNWFYIDRQLQKLTINWQGREIILWNIHLEAFKQNTRIDQIKKLLQELKQEKNLYQFVAGDFNSVTFFDVNRSEKQIEKFKKQKKGMNYFLQNTTLTNSENISEPFYTIPSWNPERKIDHIYYPKELFDLQTVKGITLPIPPSDHIPVYAEFNLIGGLVDKPE